MSTQTVIDYRRTDLRTNVLENPYWITSGEVVAVDAEDKCAVLFSFPTAGKITLVHEIAIQVTTACAGGTPAGTLGLSTLATDAVTTGGVATDVDVDDYMVTADVTWTTAGYYYPTNGSDFLTAKAAGSLTGPTVIVGAATTVYTICLFLTNSGTFTAGKVRVHALVSNIPGIVV